MNGEIARKAVQVIIALAQAVIMVSASVTSAENGGKRKERVGFVNHEETLRNRPT